MLRCRRGRLSCKGGMEAPWPAPGPASSVWNRTTAGRRDVVSVQSAGKPGLIRSLGLGTLFAIAVSSISPTTSVFVNYGAAMQGLGTGIALGFLVGGIIAILNSLVYAELGTAFPLAGGAYAILLRVFGRPVGMIVAFLYLLMGIGSVPALTLGTAGYLNVLVPGVPSALLVVIVLVLATLVALMQVHSASWVTAVMVVLEFLVILSVTALMFVHSLHPLSIGFSPHAVTTKGIGSALPGSAVFATLGITLFSFSGYELSQNFSEETMDVRRTLAKTIIISAVVAVVVETVAVLGFTVATKDFGSASQAAMPAYAVALSALGHTWATVLLVGVIIAIFDCTVAVNMSYIRVFYNAARDGMFTPRLSAWLAKVTGSSGIPGRIVLVWGALALIFSLVNTLNSAVAFTGAVLVLVYALVSLASLFARRKFSDRLVFKMPLWPVPPIIVFVALVYVLILQPLSFLELILAVSVVAGLYYLTVLRRSWPTESVIDPQEAVAE